MSFFTNYPPPNPGNYPPNIKSIIAVGDYDVVAQAGDYTVFEVQDQSLIEPVYFIFIENDFSQLAVTSITESGDVTVSDLVVLASRCRMQPENKGSTSYTWGKEAIATVLIDLLGAASEYVFLRMSGIDPENMVVVGDASRDDTQFKKNAKDDDGFTPQPADVVINQADTDQYWDNVIARNLNDYATDGWPTQLAR